jgi:putative Flp pilus-assembly TadE/G-like protein
MRIRNRRAGQTVIMFTLSLTVVFGMVGLVTDLGWAYYRKQTAQAAAQSAALAAVKAAMANGGTCGSKNVVCQGETVCPSSIQVNGGTSNVDKGCLYAQQNGYTSGGQKKVTLQTGSGPLQGVNVTYWAVAKVSEQLPLGFSVVTGNNRAVLTSRSIVGYVAPTNGGCIYVIAPNGTALTSNGNTFLTTGCGVWVNSNSATAIDLSGGNTTITDTNPDTKVQIVGGYTCYGQTTGCITPAPQTGAASAGDPLAGIDPPTDQSCTPIPTAKGKTVTMDPGTYCGSLSLQGGNSLVMNPGNYTFKSGGANSCGLSASGNATITGHGVFMYFADNCSVSFTGNGAIDLSAPTSGTYQGVLMFESRSNSTASALTGGAGQALNGILYFPDAMLHYTGGSSSNINSPAATIVAWNLQLGGNSYIWNAGTSPYLNTFAGYAILE